MQDFKRAFIHEVGHYTANVLNQRYYDGFEVKHLRLTCYDTEWDLYQGDVQLYTSDEFRRQGPSIDKLSTALASLVYGSMFESVYTGRKLEDVAKEHGRCDFQQRREILERHGLFAYASRFTDIDEVYMNELWSDEILRSIFLLIPNQYLQEVENEDDEYKYFDLYQLNVALEQFLEGHKEKYHRLINNYEEIRTSILDEK